MESDEPSPPEKFARIDVELSPEEAAVIGAMRENERARDAILNYAISFGG